MKHFIAIPLAAALALSSGCAWVSHVKQSDPDTGERVLEKTSMVSFWSVDDNQFALKNTDGEESVQWARTTDSVAGPNSALNFLANVGALAIAGNSPGFTPTAPTNFDASAGFANEQPDENTVNLMTRMKEIESKTEMLEAENARLQGELNAVHGE